MIPALGVPVHLDDFVPYGVAYSVLQTDPGAWLHDGRIVTRPAILVGTRLPTETETRARYAVRSALADVLAWLGEPVLDTPALDAAVWHYGLTRRAVLLDRSALIAEGTLQAWVHWLADHGIDPARVPSPTWVYVDDERRTIRHEGWVRDDRDRLVIVSENGDVGIARTTIDHHLGDPIAPFPGSTR